MTLSSAAGVDLKHNLCTLVLHSVVDDLSLENIFIIICLLIGWTDHLLIISNHFKVEKKTFTVRQIFTTNIAITTPTIINTDAPNISPTSICKLSDDDSNGILFKVSRKNVDNSYEFCLEKEFRLEYNNSNWYGCTFSGYKKSIPWSHWYPFWQPCKQLPFILSHVWLIQFRLHRCRQFSP